MELVRKEREEQEVESVAKGRIEGRSNSREIVEQGLMLPIGSSLQIAGLGLDILGAFIIAWPDIPKVRHRLHAGRLRVGKERLESGLPLTESVTGYGDVVAEIQQLHEKAQSSLELSDSEIERDNPLLEFSGINDDPPLDLGEQRQTIYALRKVEGSNELQPEKLGGIPYPAVAVSMNQKIRGEETIVRVIGFLCLAIGFGLQIVGQLL